MTVGSYQGIDYEIIGDDLYTPMSDTEIKLTIYAFKKYNPDKTFISFLFQIENEETISVFCDWREQKPNSIITRFISEDNIDFKDQFTIKE